MRNVWSFLTINEVTQKVNHAGMIFSAQVLIVWEMWDQGKESVKTDAIIKKKFVKGKKGEYRGRGSKEKKMNPRVFAEVDAILSDKPSGNYTYEKVCDQDPSSDMCSLSRACVDTASLYRQLIDSKDSDERDRLIAKANACSKAFEKAASDPSGVASFLKSQQQKLGGQVIGDLRQSTCIAIKNEASSDVEKVTKTIQSLTKSADRFLTACSSSCDSSCFVRSQDGTKVSCEVERKGGDDSNQHLLYGLIAIIVLLSLVTVFLTLRSTQK